MGQLPNTAPTKLHPLHTVDDVCHFTRMYGMYYPADRGTGRSTVLALKYIAEALSNPYKWIDIADHHGTLDADRYLRSTMQRMVSDIRLQHLTFRDNAVVFGLIEGKPPKYEHTKHLFPRS